jgi:hypothetical protein
MRIRIRESFLDPGSGMEKIRIRDKHPGSATLVLSIRILLQPALTATSVGSRTLLRARIRLFTSTRTDPIRLFTLMRFRDPASHLMRIRITNTALMIRYGIMSFETNERGLWN